MSANRARLDKLFAQGAIDLRNGPLFETAPPPLPDGFDFDRVEGMILGLAIGDALGSTTASMTPDERRFWR